MEVGSYRELRDVNQSILPTQTNIHESTKCSQSSLHGN